VVQTVSSVLCFSVDPPGVAVHGGLYTDGSPRTAVGAVAARKPRALGSDPIDDGFDHVTRPAAAAMRPVGPRRRLAVERSVVTESSKASVAVDVPPTLARSGVGVHELEQDRLIAVLARGRFTDA